MWIFLSPTTVQASPDTGQVPCCTTCRCRHAKQNTAPDVDAVGFCHAWRHRGHSPRRRGSSAMLVGCCNHTGGAREHTILSVGLQATPLRSPHERTFGGGAGGGGTWVEDTCCGRRVSSLLNHHSASLNANTANTTPYFADASPADCPHQDTRPCTASVGAACVRMPRQAYVPQRSACRPTHAPVGLTQALTPKQSHVHAVRPAVAVGTVSQAMGE